MKRSTLVVQSQYKLVQKVIYPQMKDRRKTQMKEYLGMLWYPKFLVKLVPHCQAQCLRRSLSLGRNAASKTLCTLSIHKYRPDNVQNQIICRTPSPQWFDFVYFFQFLFPPLQVTSCCRKWAMQCLSSGLVQILLEQEVLLELVGSGYHSIKMQILFKTMCF